jgi:hypothetical protein
MKLIISIEMEASPQLQEFFKTAISVGKTIVKVGQQAIPLLMLLQAHLGELPSHPLPQLPPLIEHRDDR